MPENDTAVRIPLFKPYIRKEAADAVAEVLQSGWLSLGPRTLAFEKAFAQYTGARYCVGTNSCTSALHLALHILDLTTGKEVITTPITYVSTNMVILYERLKPVFADIEPDTGNLNPKSVRKKITEQTGAILLVHYGGYPCDLDRFYSLSEEMQIPIIEDCSHGCGASYKGVKLGSQSTLQTFSFQAAKNLPMGDGGALTLNSRSDYDRLITLRRLGVRQESFQKIRYKSLRWLYDVSEVGYKYHMNDIEAAIGLVQLKYLEEDNAARERIAGRYRRSLSGIPGIHFLNHARDRRSSHHLFCILAEERDRLAEKLRSEGVEVNVHFRRNDLYPIFEASDLPNAERFWRQVLSLPMHVMLKDEEITMICDTIRAGW